MAMLNSQMVYSITILSSKRLCGAPDLHRFVVQSGCLQWIFFVSPPAVCHVPYRFVMAFATAAWRHKFQGVGDQLNGPLKASYSIYATHRNVHEVNFKASCHNIEMIWRKINLKGMWSRIRHFERSWSTQISKVSKPLHVHFGQPLCI
jgi:hypothetical protein